MAKYGLDDLSLILIDGYNLTGYITDFSDHKEATLEEATTAGADWQSWLFTGEMKFSLSMSGFFDDTDNASNEALCSQYASRVICYGPAGNTLGQALTMMSGPIQGKYERGPSRGEITKASVEYEGSGEVETGTIIAPLTARTTAGNTESTPENTAKTTLGGAGYLQVTALTLGGYDNVIVKLRDSADNITYGDLVSFTAVTAAPDAERKAITGDIEQYVAISWAYTGSGTGQTFTALVGLHRN